MCAWPTGGASLKVELRPLKAHPPDEGAAVATGDVLAWPSHRFAHSTAVLQRGAEVDIVVFGGVSSAAARLLRPFASPGLCLRVAHYQRSESSVGPPESQMFTG